MSLWFRHSERKNSAHEFSIHTVPCTVNRLLAERRARVDFKKPWDFVFEFKEKMGLDSIGGQNISAPFGGANASFVFILPLLDKIRTFFKENPDVEF